MTGLSCVEFYDDPEAYQKIVFPEDLHIVKNAVKAQLKGRLYDYEYRIISGGALRWLQVHSLMAYNADGTPYRLVILAQDITDRKELAALVERELERAEYAMAAAEEGIWDWLINDDKQSYHNPSFFKMLGLPADHDSTWTSAEFERRIHPDDLTYVLKTIDQEINDPQSTGFQIDYRMRKEDGEYLWIRASGKTRARDEKGRAIRMVGNHIDVTDYKKVQEALEKQVKLNEMLVKEAHHRIKNNLVLLESIVNLKRDRINNTEALDVLDDISARLNTVSGLHELLYQSEVEGTLRLGNIINKLIVFMQELAMRKGLDIELKMDLQTVTIDNKRGFSIALIINELLTNIIKYAFVPGEKGIVSICLKNNGEDIQLIVSDNGKGLPNGFDPLGTQSLGMLMINSLTTQLDATLEMSSNNGLETKLSFKL